MEQRGVIITAVVLALLLAGGLWYSLTREGVQTPAATPSPLSVPAETGPLAEGTSDSPSSLIGQQPEASPLVADNVSPTAPSGPTENIIALLSVVTIASLWQLTKALRHVA